MFRSPSTIRTLTRSHSSTSSSTSTSTSTSTFTLCITCHSSQHHRSFASTPRVHKKPLSPLINRPPSEIPPREMTNRWSKHTLHVPRIDKTLRTMPINWNASPDHTSVIQLPILALGTRNIQHQAVKDQVSQALDKGIIHIDTATGFRNFSSIATLLRESGRPRDSYFLTLKWSPADIPSNHWTAVQRMKGYIKTSGLQYVDVLMMHWPGHQTALSTSRPANYRHRYVTWRVMEDIYKEGYAKALGVANFEPGHIGEILSYCEVPPAINQIEYHPYLTHIQEHNIKFGRTHGILTTGYASLATGWSSLINEPVIQRICLQHNREFAAQNITTKRTPIQVLLRWSVQHGVPPTFRSSNPDHMSEALDIYTFELTPEEMRSINELSRIRGIGGHGKRFFGDPRLVA